MDVEPHLSLRRGVHLRYHRANAHVIGISDLREDRAARGRLVLRSRVVAVDVLHDDGVDDGCSRNLLSSLVRIRIVDIVLTLLWPS